MKTFFTFLIGVFFISAYYNPSDLNNVLKGYMDVKNALANNDSVKASEFAVELSVAINKIQTNLLSEIERKELVVTRLNLLVNCEIINKTLDIKKQRKAFSELSVSMWKLVKDSESITETVYYVYCPKKNMYWLSLEKEIKKDPYYGTETISCGTISETKQK